MDLSQQASSKKSIAEAALKNLRMRCQTAQRVQGHYLLKTNQVPVNEFIKLKLAYDHRKLIRDDIEEKSALSKKRYLELTGQFSCTNQDNRLIMTELIRQNDQEKRRSLMEAVEQRRKSTMVMVDQTLNKGDANGESNKYIYTSQNQLQLQSSPKFGKNKTLRFKNEDKYGQKKVHWEPPLDKKASVPTIMITECMDTTPMSKEESELKKRYSAFTKAQTPVVVGRLCRRITHQHHSPKDTPPLDPVKDLGFKDNFEAAAKRNSLMDEFLKTGMGQEHTSLKFYNTMKYPKNSPYGQEMRLLSVDPIVTRVNLSQAEQREKLYKYLKSKLQKHKINMIRQSSLQSSPLSSGAMTPTFLAPPNLTISLIGENASFKEQLEGTIHRRIKSMMKSPAKDEYGNFKPFKEVEFDRWFTYRLSRLKNTHHAMQQTLDERSKLMKDAQKLSHNSYKKVISFKQPHLQIRQE